MRKVTKSLRMLFVVLLATFAFATQGMAQTLLTESFENGGSVPAGWATEVVSGSSALSFVTATSWPSGYAAYNGTYLVQFASFSYSTAVNRLKRTTPISTVGSNILSVDFAWLESSGYAGVLDRVDVEWSTNGTTWTTAATINRYNAVQGWKLKSVALPAGAANQAALYIAFKFTSAYGNDCYLDFAKIVNLVAPGVAGLGSPANNATGIPVATPLVWTAPATGGAPSGYKLYVGTDNPPTNLVNGTNVGNVLTYSPAFAYLTHYNWKVVPTNAAGDATGAPVWGFTTVAPGSIAGIVTDGIALTGLPGVTVTCGVYSVMTNDDGAYSVYGLAGPNTVVFSKTGYQTVTVTGVVVTIANTTALNAQMFEEVYAPSCATAAVNVDDTQSTVTWCVPNGPYELLYDDGTAENYAAWQLPGNMNAVKFTPKGYPAKVVGGKFYVGDGTFPVGGNFMGKKFRVDVYKADGTNGMPGTFVDSASVTVNSYGWINAAIANAHEIASGSFYLVMVQLSAEPNCVPIGVDESLPKAYKSYSRNVVAGTPWVLSPYQDFMMHAVVSSPMADDDNAVAGNLVSPSRVQGMISQSRPMADAGIEMDATVTAPEGYDNYDMVSKYSLSRIFVGAVTPVPPATGVVTLLNNSITALTYTESGTTWSSLAQGWYAYGVKAVYPNAQESAFKYTNVIPHKMFADVTVNVKLVCGFVPAVGAVVTLTGADYPNDVLTLTAPASGTVFFDNVLKGNYQLKIRKSGYTDYVMSVVLTGNKTIDAVLEDLRYAPRNLFVDDMTLVATWDAPMAVAVTENFEGATFPPAGWLKTSSGIGWFASTNGGSAFFPIPAHTKYAVANDDAGGSANNGCCDYLITPSLNLTNAPAYVLSFQSYFDGAWGQSATVEMSTNGGTSWTTIYTASGAASWKQIDIDLSAYSGPAGLAAVKFAFHANDNAGWAAGWAVDDVSIASGGIPVLGYGVFLDATEVGQTPLRTWTFNPSNIHYGQTYVAGVAALFCSGYSAKNTYTFTSHFLYPPVNLTATANTSNTSGAVILAWQAPVAGDAMVAGATDYSWMQSSGTLSASGNSNNVSPSNGFTAVIDAPAAETELKYCGVNADAIGTGAAADFMVAARFTSTELYSYYGAKQITKAKIWLASSGTWSNVTLKVWEGGTATNPGTEVYSQDVTSVIAPDAYTTITLTTPVLLVASKEYWVGYRVNATSGWPAGCDAGPRVEGKGNMMYFGGVWTTLYALAPTLNYNWNVTCIINDAAPQPGANLVGYKIYRDDALLLQVPKTPLTYWDLNLLPATYCYDITAVYDLSVYGPAYAGLFGQSVKEGTACADVSYGYDLPFMETFTSGQFDINQWAVGPNWIMDGQAGNAQPSAKFKWDPLLSAYSSSLTSFYINAKKVDLGTPHKIWLDFDLKLDDRTASTKEKLTVEVWNGSTWANMKEYANNGDVNWTGQHIDISAKAKYKVFKVRFRANGDLSGDIFYWSVDNIKVYVEWGVPQNLVATSEGTPKNDIKLVWEAPAGGGIIAPGTWIHYDDGVNADAIGTGGAFDFSVAMYYPSAQLAAYDGMAIKKIKFYPNEAGCTYALRVWQGASLVVDQAVAAPTIAAWNEVTLTAPALIDITKDLYIGYRCNATTGYPAGCDAGPAVANFGDLLSEDNGSTWVSISVAYGLDYNWNIQAFVEGVGDGMAALQPIETTLPVANTGTLTVNPDNNATAANLAQRTVTYDDPTADNTEALTGYNVYRRAYAKFPAGQNTAAAGAWTKINAAIVVPTEYFDMNLSNLVTNCYEYQVTALYSEYGGQESAPTNVDWECIFVGLNPNVTNEVKVYPNPATSYVRIDLTQAVTAISVYNTVGAVVMSQNVKGETSITVNTANYAAGAYSVKFVTESGETFSRKFVVTK
ncbi:MAG: choice-of-anchor J domain-containing protein [Bacteroidota bacterium]